MSWRDDTNTIISDSGAATVQVYRVVLADFEKLQLPVPRSSTYEDLQFIESATVQIFPKYPRGDQLIRDARGEVIAVTHEIVWPWTSTIKVGDRAYESGTVNDYYEIKRIDGYEDHKEVWAEKVKGR